VKTAGCCDGDNKRDSDGGCGEQLVGLARKRERKKTKNDSEVTVGEAGVASVSRVSTDGCCDGHSISESESHSESDNDCKSEGEGKGLSESNSKSNSDSDSDSSEERKGRSVGAGVSREHWASPRRPC
jgi:hypothetical protein